MQSELLYPGDTFCPMHELKFYFLGNFDFLCSFGDMDPLTVFFFFFLNKYWGKRPKSDKETLNLAPSKKLSLIFPVLLTFLSHVGAERHMEALRKE